MSRCVEGARASVMFASIAAAAAAATIAAAATGPGVPPPDPSAPGATRAVAGCVPGAGDCFTPHAGPGCEWGPCCELVCAVMPECCTSGWDELCVKLAEELCERPPACRTAIGDCLEADKERGCRDRSCCELVCAIDPFCCTSRWDDLCAAAAAETCGVAPCVILTGTELDEAEACGMPVNDGCDQPEAFAAGAIALGTATAGRTYAVGRRDVDWYAIDPAADAAGAILTVRAAFPAEVSIVTGDCTGGFTAVAWAAVPACGDGSITLPPADGPRWVVIAPGRGGSPIVRGIPCVDDPDPPVRTFGDRYVLRLDPPPPPPR